MTKNTNHLEKFGYREVEDLIKPLEAYNEQGLPEGFNDFEINYSFNPNSGLVFLLNGDNQVCILDYDGVLKIQHFCHYCGYEGTKEELIENGNDCCKEYLDENGVMD